MLSILFILSILSILPILSIVSVLSILSILSTYLFIYPPTYLFTYPDVSDQPQSTVFTQYTTHIVYISLRTL
jgi:hypothetical protein